ncbi:hypothetical protein DOTSEDRAFT_35706 [Dothistroma septosporum NZE10]|uniref:Uncharacterized protein n=1 Tax=Dothistroma septosporum (strain NZE10 / CBS 128990) TaxID=675120 RepID=M2YP96_DOTSN|nr:hypothetical protein DOTSEDRAFT_35706 [Dothistroma septosporum NZE10]
MTGFQPEQVTVISGWVNRYVIHTSISENAEIDSCCRGKFGQVIKNCADCVPRYEAVESSESGKRPQTTFNAAETAESSERGEQSNAEKTRGGSLEYDSRDKSEVICRISRRDYTVMAGKWLSGRQARLGKSSDGSEVTMQSAASARLLRRVLGNTNDKTSPASFSLYRLSLRKT